MCLSDTEKGFQTQKRLNNPSLVGAPKCRDRNKFPQAGTGIKKTVSERRCPEGFSDAKAAE